MHVVATHLPKLNIMVYRYIFVNGLSSSVYIDLKEIYVRYEILYIPLKYPL